MNFKKVFSVLFISIAMLGIGKVSAQNADEGKSVVNKLVVLWTSDDPYVAERVALMYTHAAKTAKWFDEVDLIIWGPSAKLTAENLKIQEKLKAMQKDGVTIEACIVCAKAYQVVDDLKGLGFEVKGMGKPLSGHLKNEKAKVLTF